MLARCVNGEFSSDEMLELATHALAGIATVTHSNSTDSLLEISAHGVSKGATLSKIADHYGFRATFAVSALLVGFVIVVATKLPETRSSHLGQSSK